MMPPEQSIHASETTPAANAAADSSDFATVDCPRVGWGRSFDNWYSIVILAAIFVTAFLPKAPAQTSPVGEYELKAALLPKLGLFTQWPATTFARSGGPLVIGVLGENPFGQHLERAVQGKIIDGHPLRIQACRDIQEAVRCHILFIPGGDARAMEEALRQFAGTGVLTVSDTPGFASQGGMVNLITENQKVRLEVNLEAIQRAELRIDPQLLKLARVVKTATPKPRL